MSERGAGSCYTHHEDHDEDQTDPHDDEEGDEVVFQRKAEVGHQDHVAPGESDRDPM